MKKLGESEQFQNKLLLLMVCSFGAGFALAMLVNWFESSSGKKKEKED